MSVEPTTGGTPPDDVVPDKMRTPPESQRSHNLAEQQRQPDVAATAGFERRSPGLFEGLSAEQLVATGSFEGDPDKSEVRTGEFFSDKHTERMTGQGLTPIDRLLKMTAERLPKDVTVGIGVEMEMKQPGRSAVTYSTVRTLSQGKYSTSMTVGIGRKFAGAFVTVSGDARSQNISAGGSLKVGPVGVQGALNLTEAMNRNLAIELGISIPAQYLGIDTRSFGAAAGQVVELSVELRPVDEAYDAFVKVLGPLTDYRTFIDPFSRYQTVP